MRPPRLTDDVSSVLHRNVPPPLFQLVPYYIPSVSYPSGRVFDSRGSCSGEERGGWGFCLDALGCL